MTRAELKSMAKQQIKGNIGKLFLMALIIVAIALAYQMVTSVITVIAELIPILAFPVILLLWIMMFAYPICVTAPLTFGYTVAHMDVVAGKPITVGDLFSKFRYFWGAWKVIFFVGLFAFLWSLLFVIPGIVKSYSYRMAMYIYAENPEMGALEAITRSKEMMNGHKTDLFILDLSFVLWHLLGAATFGLAYIYISPYVLATDINFYNLIKGEPYIESASAEDTIPQVIPVPPVE